MNIRDRVRQTATNDGVTPTAFDLSAGAAVATFQAFEDAYDVSSVSSGTKTFASLPLLIEKADGSGWQIQISTVTFTWVGPAAGAGTWAVSGTLYASSTGAALSYAADEEVTVSLVAAASMTSSMQLRPLDPPSGAEHFDDGSYFPRLNTGLLAIGENAYGNGTDAVAIGVAANASGTASFALGNGVFINNAYALGSGAPGAFANNALVQTVGFVQPTGFLAGAAVQAVTFDRGILNGLTTDATPTNLGVDVTGTGTLSNTDSMYCDAGLHVIEGDLTAISDSGEMKAWHIKVVVRTELDYSAAAIVGTPVTDELYESAGATTWAVTPAVNTGTQYFTLGVTGAAATNIAWAFTYTAKYHTLYV